jgi:hypothetical protein
MRPEDFCLLGYSVVYMLEISMLVSCLAYSSTLKMEATCSYETLVDFQWTTWHYIPEALFITTAVRTSNIGQSLLKFQFPSTNYSLQATSH